jgi:hypothetical protein
MTYPYTGAAYLLFIFLHLAIPGLILSRMIIIELQNFSIDLLIKIKWILKFSKSMIIMRSVNGLPNLQA